MADAGFTIEVEGLAELLQRLGRLQGFGVLTPIMYQATALVHADIATYPPQAHRTWASSPWGGFKTSKQRRYFFRALREGVITVPYARTNWLHDSWTEKVTSSGMDLVGEVGNVRAYGPLVQDREQQAWMHQGVWPTIQDSLDKLEPDIPGLFRDGVQAALAGL